MRPFGSLLLLLWALPLCAQVRVSAPILTAPALPTPVLSPSLSAPLASPLALWAPVLPAAAASLAAPALPAAAVKAQAGPAAAAAPTAAAQAKAAAGGAWAQRLPDKGRKLEILMAGAEAHPFVKTGGLADVIDDLGRALADEGHRVTLVLPKFSAVDTEKFALERVPGSFTVPIGERLETARLWKAQRGGMDVYFLDNPNMYSRPGPYGYDGNDGYGKRDYPDNDERFLFHARASLEAMRFLGRKPDVVHAHDWHVGLMPALLKTVYAADPFFAATRSVMTIHNIAYQGLFPWTALARTGIAHEGEKPEGLSLHGMFSYLKAGLSHADALTTVSPNYAEEIRTARFGAGLQDLLERRKDDLSGILNGIDTEANDPETDPLIHRRYTAQDVAPGKAANKAELQRRLGLDADASAPVYAVASRLAEQKGIDLVIEAAGSVLKAGGQLVITGSGDKELEDAVAKLVAANPGRVARHAFDTVFVKLVYAAADFLLMPSRFEPCGLSQLLAQRYGTLPVATRTGGLSDTIRDGEDGFLTSAISAEALREAVARAARVFYQKDALAGMRAAAMAKDSSWGPSLARYLALYRSLLSR